MKLKDLLKVLKNKYSDNSIKIDLWRITNNNESKGSLIFTFGNIYDLEREYYYHYDEIISIKIIENRLRIGINHNE